MSNVVLRGAGLLKKYKSGEHQLQVLNGVDFSLSFGEKIAILGASGSGKSTLLNILAGLDQPDEGEVWLSGVRLADLNEKRLCKWRNESLGSPLAATYFHGVALLRSHPADGRYNRHT